MSASSLICPQLLTPFPSQDGRGLWKGGGVLRPGAWDHGQRAPTAGALPGPGSLRRPGHRLVPVSLKGALARRPQEAWRPPRRHWAWAVSVPCVALVPPLPLPPTPPSFCACPPHPAVWLCPPRGDSGSPLQLQIPRVGQARRPCLPFLRPPSAGGRPSASGTGRQRGGGEGGRGAEPAAGAGFMFLTFPQSARSPLPPTPRAPRRVICGEMSAGPRPLPQSALNWQGA